MPTLTDYLGIEYDGPMQGESLVQLMREGNRPDTLPQLVSSRFTVLNGNQ